MNNQAKAQLVLLDIQSAGFIVSTSKSDFTPRQTGEWLGISIDTQDLTFRVPDKKIDRLKSKISALLLSHRTTAKQLASVAGTINSMSLAIGPMVQMMTRSMYSQVSAAPSWYTSFDLSDESLSELSFWSDIHDFASGYSFRPRPVASKIVFCDASDHGYGGFLLRHLGKVVFRGDFSNFEISLSSTNRELRAVKYAVLEITVLFEKFNRSCIRRQLRY